MLIQWPELVATDARLDSALEQLLQYAIRGLIGWRQRGDIDLAQLDEQGIFLRLPRRHPRQRVVAEDIVAPTGNAEEYRPQRLGSEQFTQPFVSEGPYR